MATDIGKLYAIIGADTSQFDKKMKGIGKRLSKVGKKLTTRLTLPLLALAGAAVKAGADFEYAMTNAWAVTGEGEEALVAMTAKAREMGATTIFSAKQAGDAMYYMASAGWDSKKMADAIKPTLDLAAATQSDLAFATEAVISSMNQFQITTENTGRVTNVFAAAIMGSQATLEKLKISMTFIGPLAYSMGHEIEGTTAALMGLYNAGYEASTAGTALRMSLAKLALGTGRTKEGLKDLGLSVEDVNPEMHSMTEIIRKLEERGASATDVIKIFGVRAGPAMAALIVQGADELERLEGNITGTEAAAKMAEKQIKTFKGSFKLLISIINEASIQIFEVLGPIIKDLIDNKIRPAIEAFTKLTEGKKKLIMIIAGVVAAIGPMLLIFGTLIGKVIPGLISSIKNIGKAVKNLGKAFMWLKANPIVLVIAAVALLAFLIIKNWSKIKEVTTKVFTYIGAFFKAVWATIGDTVMTVLNFIVGYYKKVGGFLLKIGGIIGKGLVGAWKWCFSKAKEIFGAIGKVVIGALLKLANAIAKIPLVKKFGKNLKEALDAAKKKLEESKEAMKKSREESDKLKTSIEELEKAELKKKKALKLSREEVAKAVAAEEAAIEAAKKWAEFEKQIGISTIEDKGKKIKELNEKLSTLEEKYKAGKYTAIEYAEASKGIKDEIDDVNKSLDDAKEKTKAWASLQKELGISTIEEKRKKVEELGEKLGLLKDLYDEGKISLFDYTEGSKNLAEQIDELNESLDDATGKADTWISLQKELGISTIEEQAEKTAELEEKLKLLKEQYDAGVISLAAYTEGSKKLRGQMEETAITIETVGAVWNSVVKSMGESLMDWGNMTGNILKNVGKIFGTFIQETIKGIGKLVIAEMLAAKKEILIAKTKAIAKAIAKVFAKMPFPINVIIAGTMFGVVGALFAKLTKLEKGGIVGKRTIAEVAEKEPEVVSPLGKLVEIIKKAIIPIIPVPQIIMPQITAMPAGAGFAPMSRFEQPGMRERGRGGLGGESEVGLRKPQTIRLDVPIFIAGRRVDDKIIEIVNEGSELGKLKIKAKSVE